MLKKLASFSLVDTLLYANVAANVAIFVDYAETYNLIAIFYKFLNEPFESKLRVVILIGSAKEGARPTRVGIIFVFGD